MPDNDDDDFSLDDLGEAGSPAVKALRDALKRAQKDRKGLEASLAEVKAQADRAVALERELMFTKAGVTGDALGSIFQRGYDGDYSIEAIQKAWAELRPATSGTPDAPQALSGSDVAGAEAAMADRMSGASTGALTPDREAAYRAKLAAAKNSQEMIAVLAEYGQLATE